MLIQISMVVAHSPIGHPPGPKIWNKDRKFDADEESTEKVNQRFMIKRAEYNI